MTTPELPPPNFVKILPGQCKILVFDDMWYEKRKIRDPKSGKIKTVTAMVLHVIREDGLEVDKTFSVVSYKAMQTLAALARKGWLYARNIKICVYGEDFAREYQIELV